MTERLFDLLPAVHRVRDAEQAIAGRGPLEELLAVLDGELDVLRADVDALYDDWFIETCAEWLVPYIGDLLGVNGLREVRDGGLSQRAFVANTLHYRRRKGTATVLEELARDTTGWPAKAVERFELLGWTQHLNHVRLGAGGTADIRGPGPLELVDGPFDRSAHTVDVRHVDNGRGRHGIAHVAIFLWRLGAYPLTRTTARPIPSAAGAFRFDPLGLDVPLFNIARPRDAVSDPTAEPNVPGPVRRRALYDELHGISSGEDRYFGDVDPVLRIWVDGAEVQPSELAIGDLSVADRPLAPDIKVAVDPQLGRLRVAGATDTTSVEASWAYGCPGDIGAGPYDRSTSFATMMGDTAAGRRIGPVSWQRGVWRDAQPSDTDVGTDLQGALAAWKDPPFRPVGLIAMMDSRTYLGTEVPNPGGGPDADPKYRFDVKVAGGTTLIIAAGDWPDADPSALTSQRRLGAIDPSGPRPHLLGDVSVQVTSGTDGSEPGTLILDGLVIEGAVVISAGSLGRLWIRNCTILPTPSQPGGSPAVVVLNGTVASTRHTTLQVEISRSSCGPVSVPDTARSIRVVDSILHGRNLAALHSPATEIDRSTLFGRSETRSLSASEALFTGTVDVLERQHGCMRYCYAPFGGSMPRRFRCLPVQGEAPVSPAFVSEDPGDPGYAQLHHSCPAAISAGAEYGGEMGAFNFVRASERLAHLRTRTDEYLRFGLEAGVFFAT